MSSKHTPGPWKYKLGPPVVLRSERATTTAPGGTVYAEGDHSRLVVASFTLNEANARLIAAAPDMYMVLEILRDGLPRGPQKQLAINALLKAEGTNDDD